MIKEGMLTWQFKPFSDLTPYEVYEILALRQVVFVVEQQSIYVDADGVDYGAFHLTGWLKNEDDEKLVAYLRVIPPGVKYDEMSIGRVITSPQVRRTGAGKQLMKEVLRQIESRFGNLPIRISAQAYLEKFYQNLGFQTVSAEAYLEDGIPHLEMLRPKNAG